MIISHRYKFVFIKTRKTASTSIELALGQLLDSKDDFATQTGRYKKVQDELKIPYREKSKRLQHAGWDWEEVSELISEQQWNNYFKFAIERNPWDKVVSLYYFFKGRNKKPSWEITDFNQYIEDTEYWKRGYNWSLYADEDKPVLDYIGTYENLSKDLEIIEDKLKIKLIDKLPKANSDFRENKDYRKMYTSDWYIDKISDFYKKEINYFNYRF